MKSNAGLLNKFGVGPQNEALLIKLTEKIENNLQNEQFGVNELANLMSMSRSSLHRKLKRVTGQSISLFIRKHRLQCAMEFLKKEDLSISEVSFKVGFGSSSYFTNCFTKYYGYPPSEVKQRIYDNKGQDQSLDYQKKEGHPLKIKKTNKLVIGGLMMLCLFVVFQYFNNSSKIVTYKDKSIAVLPFENLNHNQGDEYFSVGVVGTITTSLSEIRDLKVTSPNTAQKYFKSNKSDKEIARELKVSYLLQGSIQHDQGNVQIKVYLIDANNEQQIWAENYDSNFNDILKIQRQIAEKVTLALRLKLSSKEIAAIEDVGTDNVEAYDLYLNGLYHFRTYTNSGTYIAIDYFEQAIALDSSYANAYSGLAECNIVKASVYSSELSALDAFVLAKPFLDKALSLDSKNIRAHTSMGFYFLYNNWDFEEAEKEYKKAIVTDDPDALALYTDFLNFTRRHDEALIIAERLNRVNPYYPNSRMILTLYYLGRYEEAIKFAESRIKVFNNYQTLDTYGFLMLNTGNHQEAIELFQRAIDLERIRHPRMLGWVGAAYAKSGQQKKALKLMTELKIRKTSTDAGSPAFFIAVIYAALHEREMALQWLEIANQDHEMEMPWLISEPQFYSLHNEPAFQALRNKIGFP